MPKEVHLKVYTMYKFAFAVSCTLFNMLIRFLCAVVCFENVLARSLKSSFRTKMSWLVTHYMFCSCVPLPLPIPIPHNSLSQNRSNSTHCVESDYLIHILWLSIHCEILILVIGLNSISQTLLLCSFFFFPYFTQVQHG